MQQSTPEIALNALQNNTEEEIEVNEKPTIDLVVKMATALENNTKCMCLSFVHCGLEDVDCKALAEALEKNSTLKELYLDNNRIGDIGATALAVALEKNSTLEVLGLRENRFREVGMQAFSKALLKNSGLQELYLAYNMNCDVPGLSKSYLLSSAPLIEFRPKSYISLKALRKVFHAALEIDPERVYSRLVLCCETSDELLPLLFQLEAYRKVCIFARFIKNKPLPRELLILTLKYLL